MEVSQNISRSDIQNFLTRRLGEKEAAELMIYMDEAVAKEVKNKKEDFNTQMIAWKDQMGTLFSTKEDAKDLQLKLVKQIGKAESTLILWGFVFWLTQMLAVLCFLKFFK